MKKALRFFPVLAVAFALASCDITIISGSSSSEDSSSGMIVGGGSTDTSSSEEVSSSESSEELISSSEPESSSSEEPEPPAPVHEKTVLAQTYDEYHEYNYFALDNTPTLGCANLLVIPVWFNDSSNYITTTKGKDQVRKDINAAFFGTEEETGWQSVRGFYETESQGNLFVNGKTTDWFNVNCDSSECTDNVQGTYSTNNIIKAATDWYFQNNPTDSRRNYDGNGDGYLDGVICIYAAPNYASGRHGNNNLWAYTYWLQNSRLRNTTNPGPNTYFWSSYDFLYSSSRAYQITGTQYGYGDNSHFKLDTHTFIHEMGHAFGLDDLYDYGSNGYSPAGQCTMQDYNVCGHDPYSVMGYGWADPYIVEEAGDYVLRPFQSSHDVLLLTPEWNEFNSPFDEYVLVELYTPTGLNEMDATYALQGRSQGPTRTGIRVWHVDARLVGITSQGQFGEETITTNCYVGKSAGYRGITHAFSNTYATDGHGSYFTQIDQDYQNYNLVQYIRKDTRYDYRPRGAMNNNNMFYSGDSFSMYTYNKQFFKGDKLNSGKSLGWGFAINIEGEGEDAIATISVWGE